MFGRKAGCFSTRSFGHLAVKCFIIFHINGISCTTSLSKTEDAPSKWSKRTQRNSWCQMSGIVVWNSCILAWLSSLSKRKSEDKWTLWCRIFYIFMISLWDPPYKTTFYSISLPHCWHLWKRVLHFFPLIVGYGDFFSVGPLIGKRELFVEFKEHLKWCNDNITVISFLAILIRKWSHLKAFQYLPNTKKHKMSVLI